MTIAVDWDVKQQNKQNKVVIMIFDWSAGKAAAVMVDYLTYMNDIELFVSGREGYSEFTLFRK